jgi:glutathione synthase/RimK-type ligase-like ATP-grasp enzyme
MSSAYPEQTDLVARAAASLGMAFTDLDGGYLFEVRRGEHAFIGGGGTVTPYPLNRAASVQIARDKAHANTVLSRGGLPVIESRLYFVHDRRRALRGPGREVSDAVAAIEAMGRPVFCKPNAGSGGDYAEIVADAAAFLAYAERVKVHHEAVLVQPIVQGAEHRVFCLDGRALFATRKAEAALVGDGISDLAALLARHNAGLEGSGVSPTPIEALIDPTHVPAAGQRVSLAGRRNIASGGTAEVAIDVPQALADVAVRACAALSLRIGGVDVFDRSHDGDLSDLVIVEVNGNPGLTSLIEAGREDLAEAIWREVLQTHFAELER